MTLLPILLDSSDNLHVFFCTTVWHYLPHVTAVGLWSGVGADKGRLSEWIQHHHNAAFIHNISQVWFLHTWLCCAVYSIVLVQWGGLWLFLTMFRHQNQAIIVSMSPVRLVTYCSRAFSIAGPVCWNGVPDYLKSLDLSFDSRPPGIPFWEFTGIVVSWISGGNSG